MGDSGRPEPPRIVVLRAHEVPPADPMERELLAGIEEEGVPAVVETGHEALAATAVGLAERAAERSILEVGVGLGKDGVCVTHRALPSGSPLGHAAAPVAAAVARRLGHDAARVVTGVPLKPTPRSTGTDPSACRNRPFDQGDDHVAPHHA